MHKVVRWLYRIEDTVLVALLLGMIVLAGLDIVARTLLDGGMTWVSPVLRILVLWTGLLGALVATRSREHIAIDVLSRFASAKAKRVMNFVASSFGAVVSGLLAYYSGLFVQTAYEFGDVAFDAVLAWPLQLIMPISFSLMALRFAAQAVDLKSSEPEL